MRGGQLLDYIRRDSIYSSSLSLARRETKYREYIPFNARKKVKTIESCFQELFFVNGYCESRVKVTPPPPPPPRRNTLALSNYICILQKIHIYIYNIYKKIRPFLHGAKFETKRKGKYILLLRANFS